MSYKCTHYCVQNLCGAAYVTIHVSFELINKNPLITSKVSRYFIIFTELLKK